MWVQFRGKSLLVDTSTDLRQQAIREKIPTLDAVLYTHAHSDHINGIDELRSFNYVQKTVIPAYGCSQTCDELESRLPYIFHPNNVQEGGGVPRVYLNRFDPCQETVKVAGVDVIPVLLKHGSLDCIGYRFDSIAYLTDCSYIPPASLKRLQGLSVLVLDCLRIVPHGTHFNLEQALEVVSKVLPKRTFLTHLGHDLEYQEWKQKLSRMKNNVELAYDGLEISVRP